MTTEIKYKDVEDAAYEEAQKLAPNATHSGADAKVSRPGAYDKSIVAAVNALCDVICAEDVNVGDTAEDALDFLSALLGSGGGGGGETAEVQITVQEYDASDNNAEFPDSQKHAKVYSAEPALSQENNQPYWKISEEPVTSAPIGSFIVLDSSIPPTNSYQLARVPTVPAANGMQLGYVGNAGQSQAVFPVPAGIDTMPIKIYWEEVG